MGKRDLRLWKREDWGGGDEEPGAEIWQERKKNFKSRLIWVLIQAVPVGGYHGNSEVHFLICKARITKQRNIHECQAEF